MNFGDRLRILIDERGITQKELASQLNIAPSTVSSYVQNTREPDFTTLKSLAIYFSVSIDYLLGWRTTKAASREVDGLIWVFRSLRAEQNEVGIEQCKVFVRLNQKARAKSS